MAVKFAVDKLRDRAQRLHKEYEALCVLSNSLTINSRALLDSIKSLYADANKTRLREGISRLEKAIANLRRDFGFRVSNSEVLEIVEGFKELPENRTALMNKEWLDDICTGYKKYWPLMKGLPAHAMVEINLGNRREWGELTWYLLEAIAFEDMCALFNQAKEFELRLKDSMAGKSTHKTRDSLLRATILAAYHFVEAY
jgi:hypothetical protein